jgi:hypothetical protein
MTRAAAGIQAMPRLFTLLHSFLSGVEPLSKPLRPMDPSADLLRACCAGFEAMPVVPRLFVLIGNFHSGASPTATAFDFAALRDHFANLAATIEQYPRIRVRAVLGCQLQSISRSYRVRVHPLQL